MVAALCQADTRFARYTTACFRRTKRPGSAAPIEHWLEPTVTLMLEGEELLTVDRCRIMEVRYVCETENGSTCRRDHWGRRLCNRPCLRASLRAGTACAGPGAFSANRPFRGYRRSDAQYLLLRCGAARRDLGKRRQLGR